MRKLLYLTAIFVFILSACNEREDLIVDSPQKKANLKSIVTYDPCQETVFDLIAGQYMDVGSVTIANDNDNLYVTYDTEDGWMIQEIHIYIGDDIPLNKKGTPVIGHFPYYATGLLTDSYTYVIPLDEVLDDCFYIFTHAVVVKENGVDEYGEIIWTDETAWGCGDYDFETEFGTTRWGCFAEYCLGECPSEYLTFKVQVINEATSNYNFADLTDGEHIFISEDWCNNLGIVPPVDGMSYELVAIYRDAGIVAFAEISIEENDIVVDITAADGFKLKSTFVFYGTKAELFAYGNCPAYWWWPYQVYDVVSSTHHIIIPMN